MQRLRSSLGPSGTGLSLPAHDLAVRAWALAVWGQLRAEDWEAVLDTARRLAPPAYTDGACLFLVHTSMLIAG